MMLTRQCPECKSLKQISTAYQAMGMWVVYCVGCCDGERGHPMGTGRGRNAAIDEWNDEVAEFTQGRTD